LVPRRHSTQPAEMRSDAQTQFSSVNPLPKSCRMRYLRAQNECSTCIARRDV
jgi:hypothetical protein